LKGDLQRPERKGAIRKEKQMDGREKVRSEGEE
jgi:hypothetical protein